MPTKTRKLEAMTTLADFEVPTPTTQEAEQQMIKTFVAQVGELEINQTIAKAEMIDPWLPSYKVIGQLSSLKQRLLARMTPAIKQVKGKTGRQFQTDCGDLIMPKGTWFIVVTVTRVS